MKAMILAAGLGTRLRPLTDKRPKALVPVVNEPMIGRVVAYLKAQGASEIIINAHHYAQQIVEYLDCGRPFGLKIHVRIEPRILGTGGGIKNAEDFWDERPFVVINGDVLTDVDLRHAYERHKSSGALSTLILHDCEPYNQIEVDQGDHIKDIGSRPAPGRWAFTGIHILDPGLLSFIPEGQFTDIIETYRRLIGAGEFIRAHVTQGHYWRDIGTPEQYVRVNRELLGKESFCIGPECHIHPEARLEEWAILGEGVTLEKDALIRRSILWDKVTVKRGIQVIDSTVTTGREVGRHLTQQVY